MLTSKKKKFNVFISYHYAEARFFMEKIKNILENNLNCSVIHEKINYKIKNLSDQAITKIIRENYLRISNLVIVLVSKNAWRRKHIDWEVSAALRHTKLNSRKPILVIFTPDYGSNYLPLSNKTPVRIIKNIKIGYIKTIFWKDINSEKLKNLIDFSINSAKNINPVNNEILRRKNNEKER